MKIFEILLKFVDKLQPVGAAWIGTEPIVIVSSARDIDFVLNHKSLATKGFVYKFAAPWIGLATESGEIWSKKKKLFLSFMKISIIKDYLEVFNTQALHLVDRLKKEEGKPGFDICPYLNYSTIETMSEISLGCKINSSDVYELFKEMTLMVMERCFKPWNTIDFLFSLTNAGRKYYKNVNKMKNLIFEIVEKRRQEKQEIGESTKQNVLDESNKQGKMKEIYLDTILDQGYDGKPLTNDEIVIAIADMIVLGYETISTTTSFVLYGLSRNPHVQEKVIQELNEIFGDSDRNPTLEDFLKMKYLDKVIKESLRLWQPAPFMLRYASEDTALPDGTIMPKGCSVLIALHKLHRNPKIFPDPETFNPERFNDENINSLQHCYFPFSGGSRACLGKKFAEIVMKVIVSNILRKFKILPPIDLPDIKLSMHFLLLSTTGINIRLVNRKPNS